MILYMHKRLQHESSLTIQLWIYKCIHRLFNVYMTYLSSFVSSMVWCMYTSTANWVFVGANKIKFCYLFFAYSSRPLLENADIYTSTLILCNSFNYNLIDTKLNTIFDLLFFYHSFELYSQTYWYQCCTA